MSTAAADVQHADDEATFANLVQALARGMPFDNSQRADYFRLCADISLRIAHYLETTNERRDT